MKGGKQMQWIYQYDVAACSILFIIAFLFFTRKNYPDNTTRVYTVLIIDTIVTTVMDLFTIYAYGEGTKYPIWFLYLITMIYLFSENMVAVLFYVYIVVTTKESSKAGTLITAGVIISDFIFIASSGITHLAFYFKDGAYVRSPGLLYLYTTSLLMLTMGLISTIKYRRRLTLGQRIPLYFFTIASIFVVVYQTYYPDVLLIDFACALFTMLIYISLQNPEEYVERDIDTLNSKAFYRMISSEMDKKKTFMVVAFELDGFKYINEILGVNNGNELIASVAKYLQSEFSGDKVFHLSGIRFAVIANTENYEQIISTIQNRFNSPWKVTGIDIALNPLVCYVQYPKQVSSAEEITYAIDYSIQEAREKANGHAVFASRDFLSHKHRETAITQIIKYAIMNDGFEVYYQPIYDIERGKFVSAEALVRLKDCDLGFISPEEFIPIAEKSGTILKIGKIVFTKVCKFLKESEANNYGLEYIEVNLSVVQCMQEDLAEQLLHIMDEYDIEYSRINLEITETANFNRNDILIKNMNNLISKGITFSMDDYGTGFSTTNYLIELPFRIVKIDKSIVWAAMENEKALKILNYTVKMIKSLELMIVAEGVESMEQVKILESIGCNYLQGYFYSRPIPEKDYIKFLKVYCADK